MAREVDPLKLSSPHVFLVRMLLFVAAFGAIVFVLQKQIQVGVHGQPCG